VAFALGALAHYVTDTTSHPRPSTDRCHSFSKARREVWPEITSVEAPKEHVIAGLIRRRAERGRDYQLDDYRRFIGFRVTKPLLERAFAEPTAWIKDVFPSEDRAISTYECSVSQIHLRSPEPHGMTSRRRLRRKPQRSSERVRVSLPSDRFRTREPPRHAKPALLPFSWRGLPDCSKFGPLKRCRSRRRHLKLRVFIRSFKGRRTPPRSALEGAARRLDLQNADFDTGKPARHGEYALADETC
jgi:hypothetical protein